MIAEKWLVVFLNCVTSRFLQAGSAFSAEPHGTTCVPWVCGGSHSQRRILNAKSAQKNLQKTSEWAFKVSYKIVFCAPICRPV